MTATPRRPSLWDQANSTRGGRIAVIVAIVAVCLLVATAAVALAASARQDQVQNTSASADRSNPGQGKGQGQGQGQGPDKSNNGNGNTNKDKAGQGNGDLSSIPGRLGGTLHGEVTRPSAAGGTETLLVQNGTVTAVGATEVTVKSSDGFTDTYAISADTTVRGPAKAGGLAAGTDVTVVATKDGKRALLVASRGKPS